MNGRRLCMIAGWDELYDKAGALGAELVLLHAPDKLALLRERPHITPVAIDIGDIDGCVATAERLHAETPLTAVVSFTEWGLESAAAIVERLGPHGVRGNAARPVRLTRDKLAMRDLLLTANIPTIPYRRCGGPVDVLEFQQALGRPVIVKPAKGAGSAGVALARTADDVPAAWETARSEAAAGATAGGVIVEAFIPGHEFSVDTMSYDGEHEVVAIAEKITTGSPRFVELGHQVPARLDPTTEARIEAVVTAFLDAIGQQHGPAHTEFKLTGGEVVIIESQTRTGGDQIWELNRLATGYDLHLATMRHLLFDLRTPHPCAGAPRQRAAAVRFFTAKPGTVVAVNGVEQAAACPGVQRFKVDVAIGDGVTPLTGSSARLGYVVCDAATVEGAVACVEEAHRHVTVVTDCFVTSAKEDHDAALVDDRLQ